MSKSDCLNIFIYNASCENEKDISAKEELLEKLAILENRIKTRIVYFSNFILGILNASKTNKESTALSIPGVTNNQKQSQSDVSKIKAQRKGDADMKYITFRVSDGRYVGRKTVQRKRLVVYGKTQQECYLKLKEAIKKYQKNSESIKIKKETNITLLDYYKKWYYENKEPFVTDDTKKDILRVMRVLEPLHNIVLKKLTKEVIINFLNTLKENRTKEKVIIYFKAAMKSAVLDKVISENPFNNLRTNPVKQKTKPAFSYEEQVKILQMLKGTEIEPIILIYLITGMRKFEFNFKSIEKDIDLKTNILKAQNLKGRNKVIRYKKIKLSDEAISLIMNNLSIIHRYSAETAYRAFAQFLKEIKIKGSIVTCRHTFATNCFYLGKPELLISREMGHSSTEITKKVYTDIDYDLSKDKIIKLYNNLYNLD